MPKSKEEISYNMSRIRGRDTSIEVSLRKALYHQGYRYQKNVTALPGSPDIVLKKYRIAIFCDGDFFHGYDLSKTESQLKANKDFWAKKIEANRLRDLEVNQKLVALGYYVLRFWEHEIRNDINAVIREIELTISKQENKNDRA